MGRSAGRLSQARKAASAKSLRQEFAWCVGKTEEASVAGGESVRSEGKSRQGQLVQGRWAVVRTVVYILNVSQGRVLSQGGLFYDWGFKDTG